MVEASYSPPVDALLELGEKHLKRKQGISYVKKFGFTEADIPELIRLATDHDLNWADSLSKEVWAPVHAWRALGELKAEAAIEPLLSMFNELWEGDWFNEDMPDVFAGIGPTAIPQVKAFLENADNQFYSRWTALNILVRMAETYPETRDACVQELIQQLEHFDKNNREWNGVIISTLIDLEAKEAAPLMEKAFSAKWVDISIAGDWTDVQLSMGLISPAEARERRHSVDAENIAAKAPTLSEKPQGFGASPQSSKKRKKK
jgi:hypothetical protein